MAITSLLVFVLDTILQCQFYFGLTILNFDSEGSFVPSDHCSQPLISMFVSDCAHSRIPGTSKAAPRNWTNSRLWSWYSIKAWNAMELAIAGFFVSSRTFLWKLSPYDMTKARCVASSFKFVSLLQFWSSVMITEEGLLGFSRGSHVSRMLVSGT